MSDTVITVLFICIMCIFPHTILFIVFSPRYSLGLCIHIISIMAYLELLINKEKIRKITTDKTWISFLLALAFSLVINVSVMASCPEYVAYITKLNYPLRGTNIFLGNLFDYLQYLEGNIVMYIYVLILCLYTTMIAVKIIVYTEVLLTVMTIRLYRKKKDIYKSVTPIKNTYDIIISVFYDVVIHPHEKKNIYDNIID